MSDTRDIDAIRQQAINNVPGNTFQDKLNHLSTCNCCERHQINKPTIFMPWIDTPLNDTPLNDNDFSHLCMCNCRHVARLICRQAFNSNPPTISRFYTPNSIINLDL